MSSRRQRYENRQIRNLRQRWPWSIPRSVSALNRQSRSQFWSANREYSHQCLDIFSRIGCRYSCLPTLQCFICAESGLRAEWPCGHSICQRCTVNMITVSITDRGQMQCPFCRRRFQFTAREIYRLRIFNSIYDNLVVKFYMFYDDVYLHLTFENN